VWRCRRAVPRWSRRVGGQSSGGLDWPSESEPQHSTLAAVQRPQVYSSPALTVSQPMWKSVSVSASVDDLVSLSSLLSVPSALLADILQFSTR
jgi:hypothetical protein